MELVVAAVRPTPILWWRASGLASPTEVPASTLPARGIAPVRANIASRSVVLPLWNGPTSAMHRGPRGLLTSCPIAASSSGARPLIGSAGWMLSRHQGFGKPEKRRWCTVSEPQSVSEQQSAEYRHCEQRNDEAIQPSFLASGIFGEPGIGRAFARPVGSQRRKKSLDHRPGRSSRLSKPAATLRPTWPCTLSGCSAIEFAEPPTSTLPPSPTPTDALPCAPT